MGSSSDWKDASYQKNYEDELRHLQRRLASDPSCSIEELEGTLKNLYIMDGSDWLGRGEVQTISLAATIAAHEVIIGELKTARK